jgi:hypothetical protein
MRGSPLCLTSAYRVTDAQTALTYLHRAAADEPAVCIDLTQSMPHSLRSATRPIIASGHQKYMICSSSSQRLFYCTFRFCFTRRSCICVSKSHFLTVARDSRVAEIRQARCMRVTRNTSTIAQKLGIICTMQWNSIRDEARRRRLSGLDRFVTPCRWTRHQHLYITRRLAYLHMRTSPQLWLLATMPHCELIATERTKSLHESFAIRRVHKI